MWVRYTNITIMANQIMGISSVKVLKCTLTVVIELGVWGILPQEF